MLGDILIPGEGWELVSGVHDVINRLSSEPSGVLVLINDITDKYYRLSPGGLNDSITFHIFHKKQDYINDMVRLKSINNIWDYSTISATSFHKGELVLQSYSKNSIDSGPSNPFGLAFTPDHTQLYVTESNSHWVWIYNINTDGTLSNKQHYGWLHVPDTAENAAPRGIKVDRDGRVYVATNMGIQVMYQIGRVNAILPLPIHSGQPVQLCFGGPNFDELYVSCGDKIYRRKLKVRGMNDFDTAVKPPKPHL
jgi:DNA-binding beta-propeller fold protein YncE